MSKIPLYYKDDEFFSEFGTSCYINQEKMVNVFPLYRHDFIEISMVLEGNGREVINGTTYDVCKGSLSVTAPWHFHTVHTDPEKPVKRFICEFSMEDYLRYASIWPQSREALFRKDAPACLRLDDKHFEQVYKLFNDMYLCFIDDDEDKQIKLYLKLIEFMMLFAKLQRQAVGQQGNQGKATDEIAAEALRYMHRNFSEDLSLSSASREIGVGTAVLREQLLAYTGQDFNRLLTDIRIRNACILLGLKTPTIEYVAFNTGFHSLQTFYRAFTKIKGVTPQKFREQHWMESEGKAGYLMYNNKVWDILYYIHRHFDEDLSPESVAREMSISVSYLHQIIQYNLMQSFSELLHEIRVSYASGLLSSSDAPIAQIAVEVGYNNSKTFSRAFQKQKGYTPAEYRAKMKQGQS